MILILVIILFIILFLRANTYSNYKLTSKYYLVYSVKKGKIVKGKGCNTKIQIGSLQKVITTITALEAINNQLDDIITITEPMLKNVDSEASVVGYRVGDLVSIRELVYSILIKSGADATSAISYIVFGSESLMVKAMNEKVKSLGAKNTSIKNTTGLDTPGQYTTLNDYLICFRHAITNQTFIEAFSMTNYEFSSIDLKIENEVLRFDNESRINMLFGAKRGFTENAGRCLVSMDKSQEFVVIVANSKEYSNNFAYIDSIKLYNYIYKNNY